MGICVGSSCQFSPFVTLIVMVGWMTDIPMTLNFPHFEVTFFIFAIVVVAITVSNPKSNWLEGSISVTVYLTIAIGILILIRINVQRL